MNGKHAEAGAAKRHAELTLHRRSGHKERAARLSHITSPLPILDTYQLTAHQSNKYTQRQQSVLCRPYELTQSLVSSIPLLTYLLLALLTDSVIVATILGRKSSMLLSSCISFSMRFLVGSL